MKDIASQLVLKWARGGEKAEILLTDDFTRLTLDTIALCSMDYRFNSFYTEKMHPYVDAMVSMLSYAGIREKRPKLYTQYMASAEEAKWREDTALMDRIAQEVIDHRRANPVDKDDLLNCLLYKKDPKTGKVMRDALICSNMNIFLVAGK